MKSFFEHVIQLPASFHSDEQSGRLIAVMLRGTDHLFTLLLSVFREHLTAVVMLVALVPTMEAEALAEALMAPQQADQAPEALV